MKICHNCGATIPDDQNFCGKCGTAAQQNYKECINCGERLPESESFCKKCGTYQNMTSFIPKSDANEEFYQKKSNSATIIKVIIVAAFLIIFLTTKCINYNAVKTTNLNNYRNSKEVSSVSKNTKKPESTPKIESIKKFDDSSTKEENISGNTYINEDYGIKCVLPGWKYSSKSQVASESKASDAIADSIAGEDYDGDSGSELLMSAESNDRKNRVEIRIQSNNIGLSEGVVGEKLLMFGMKSYIKDSYNEKLGGECCTSSDFELDVNGTKKHAALIEIDFAGVKMDMMYLSVIKDDSVALITIVGDAKDECIDICNSFYFS